MRNLANLNWEYSKSRKLHNLFEDEDSLSVQEKNALVAMEFEADIALAMATGNVSTWIMLLALYDEDKSLANQSLEFQRQATVTAASMVAMPLTLHYMRMSALEFFGYRMATIGQVTKYAKHPLIVTPVAALYLATKFPEIAGPQYQSSMSGQPGIGSAGTDLIYGNKSFSDYWDAIFQ